jgi:hypothetical protein
VTYAATTSVSVSKTKGEIAALLRKHKATAYATMEEASRAQIAFHMNGRHIIFRLPLPDPASKEYAMTARGQRRSADAQLQLWEQACRSRWRALFLCIKAKLESIESGIETFEDAFLAHIMMPDGVTVGEHAKPMIARSYESGTMQPLLPAPGA